LTKRLTTYFATIFLLTFIAYSGDTLELRPSYILFGNYHQNYHKSNFSALPDVPNCCPTFKNGEGPGFSFGLNYEFMLPYKFSIGLGLGYYDWGATLTADETKPVRIGNNIETALIKHTLNTDFTDIGFTPYANYKLVRGLNIFVGGHIGAIISSHFHQYETLVEPAGSIFYDTGTNVRNDVSGAIPDIETVYSSLFFGLQYDIRLGNQSYWMLSPTLTYNWGRSAIIKNYDWTASALMLGLQLKYSPPVISKTEEVFKDIVKIDTVTILSEDFMHNTVVQGEKRSEKFDETSYGKIVHKTIISRTDTLFKRPVPRISVKINAPVIILEGQFITQAFPLIPVVFFTKNSADLSEYYIVHANTDSFSIEKIKIDPLEYQRHLLNIIGKRMTENPDAKIFITGYCDSLSEGVNYELAAKRAKSLVNFFNKKWQIPVSRLIFKPGTQCNPPNATETQNDSGYADNRRAELYSDSPQLLAPIKHKRFIEPRVVNPNVLLIDPSGSTSKDIARWSLVLKKGDSILSNRSGNGFPGILKESLKLKDFNLLFNNEPLKVEFSMVDYEGQIGQTVKEIQVQADTSEYELQRLSLILFDVGNDKLSEEAKTEIREFMKGITPNSIVRVNGFTDPLGSSVLNIALSRKRAENTALYIEQLYSNIKIESVKGYASAEFPPGVFAYQTPIERFLARTVFIEVLKKIK